VISIDGPVNDVGPAPRVPSRTTCALTVAAAALATAMVHAAAIFHPFIMALVALQFTY
jgi:hypothetical protein